MIISGLRAQGKPKAGDKGKTAVTEVCLLPSPAGVGQRAA